MTILPLDEEYWNVEIENFYDAPAVIADVASKAYYILIKNLPEELSKFIQTGKGATIEFRVFPEEQEKSIKNYWKGLGLTVTYRSQKIDYMERTVTIVFLQVLDPETGVKVSLIPWFMLPDRPFPAFAYVYGIWHYHKFGKKSLSRSAAATGKLFGIESFNKSTLLRNIKAMENFIDTSQIDRPLNAESCQPPADVDADADADAIALVPSILNATTSVESLLETYKDKAKPHPVPITDADAIELVPSILSAPPSVEALSETYQCKVKPLPAPINDKDSISYILSGIPDEHSQIIKEKIEAANESPRDKRVRPARPRGEGQWRVQRQVDYVARCQLDKTRKAFIEVCRCLILDAAASYNSFLI